MLKCRDVAQQASDYIESERPWYRKLGWYMHLFMCKHCRKFVRHLKLTVHTTRKILKLKANDEQVHSVMKSIEKNQSDLEK